MEYDSDNRLGLGLSASELVERADAKVAARSYKSIDPEASILYLRAALYGSPVGVKKFVEHQYDVNEIEENKYYSSSDKLKKYRKMLSAVQALMEFPETAPSKPLLAANEEFFEQLVDTYDEILQAQEKEEQRRIAEEYARKEEKKRRRRELWANIGMAVLSGVANSANQMAYVTPYGYRNSSAQSMNQLLDPRLAMQQVMQQQAQYNALQNQLIQITQQQAASSPMKSLMESAERAGQTIDWSNYSGAFDWNNVDPSIFTFPNYGIPGGAVVGGDNSTGSSSDYWSDENMKERKQTILNRAGGDKCGYCKGSGKCHACKGTKVASSFGNTYPCNVCNDGICPQCHGTGTTPWNR